MDGTTDKTLVRARWRLGAIRPADLRQVAGDLLAAGESSPSLIELFGLPDLATRWEGPQLFEKALDELGAPRLTDAEAATIVAQRLAEAVLDGSRSLGEACAEGARLHYLNGYEHEPLGFFYVLDDELASLDRNGHTHLGRTAEAITEDVRTFEQTMRSAQS